MISDNDLYRLAVVLGSFAMVLIVVYHFLEVNSVEETPEEVKAGRKVEVKAA
jgi:oligosaccharyl transferase complex subunit OST4